ncbi:hypothetical protein FHR90_002438 [Endobacter medicaginis]|uniref:Chorismate lyase n=1 Tax=Endobacter medicaginis TaxID=1181271 RepID=A0A839V1L3_9PROT|nr:hypothetical protein [Endobacter medicaginis]MBB3174593.1 hypothetical protein [Endobacter medicaginis]MCX5474715.1 hypothetical protein [Endobacter medicaginis]NVN30814.1 hypothetical protein [Endobacter medicaginis]
MIATALISTPDELAALDTALRSGPSATAVLASWCAARGLAGRMHVERLDVAGAPSPAEPSGLLPTAGPRYRRIRMFCGDIAVSEAENWYDETALDPAMQVALARTDTPFGIAVAGLRFQRRLIAAQLDARGLEHRAALYRSGHEAPFCVVVERYGCAAPGETVA